METGQIHPGETITTPQCKMTGRRTPAQTVRTARSTRTIPTGPTPRRRISLSTPSNRSRIHPTARTLPRVIRTRIVRTRQVETPTTRTLRGRRSKIISSLRRRRKTADIREAGLVTEVAPLAVRIEKAGASAPAFVVPRGLHRSRTLLDNNLSRHFGMDRAKVGISSRLCKGVRKILVGIQRL